MANNTRLNEASGTSGDLIATEEIGAAKYELIKLIDATAGSTTPVGTSANPLRLDPTGTTTQPVSGPLTDTQLRASAVPASLATLPALVASSANIGDVDVLTLPALVSGSANIGDVDVLTIAAGTNRIGATYDVGGQLQDEVPTLRTVNRAFVNASLSGNTELVAAQGVGVRVRVLSIAVVATLAVTIKFQSATTDITAGFPVAATGGMVLPYNPHGWFETTANEALNINLGIGTATGCQITWVQST